ncbi:MAG: sugar transferase, partial [bacterium]
QSYLANQKPGQQLIGASSEFSLEMLKNSRCDRVVLGIELDKANMLKLIRFCEDHTVTLQYIPSLVGLYTSHMTIDTVAGYPFIELAPTPLAGWGRIVKRVFDIVLSFIGIVVLSPVLLVIAIAVKLNSRGPVIYAQTRVGELGNPFTFYKFRSMYTEMSPGLGGQAAEEMLGKLRERNEADGPLFKLKEDPRITRVGKFIRRTSLDELPQLFNVFIGNMSLVGSRPALPNEVEQYADTTKRRLLVKPGVTGLWQVSGRSDASFEDYVQLDVYYLEHWSLWLDIKLILLTFRAVFARRGSY